MVMTPVQTSTLLNEATPFSESTVNRAGLTLDPLVTPKAASTASRETAFIWRNAATDQTAGWAINGTTYQTAASFQNTPNLGPNSEWTLIDTEGVPFKLFWRNAATDQTAVWNTDETGSFTSGAIVANAPQLGANSDWKLISATSINNADTLVWRNAATDQTALWTLNGNTFATGSVLSNTPSLGSNSPWQLIDAATINGKLDLIWRNSLIDQTAIWTFNGTQFETGAIVSNAPSLGANSPWQLVKADDLDGNNNADLVWQNRSTGQQAIWFLNGTQFTTGAIVSNAPNPDANWQIVGLASVDLSDLAATPPTEATGASRSAAIEINPVATTVADDGTVSLTAAATDATPITLFWRNDATDQTALWNLSATDTSTTFTSGSLIQGAPPLGSNSNWKLVDAGSLSTDTANTNQFLWRNDTTDETAVWTVNGTTFQQGTVLTGTPRLGSNSGWKLVGEALINNARTLIWRNDAADQTAAWTFNGTQFVSGTLLTGTPQLGSNSGWQIVDVVSDNSTLALLWRNQTTDETGIWGFNGAAFAGALITDTPQLGSNSPWQLRKIANVQGDGTGSLVWQNSITGQQAVWFLDGLSYDFGAFVQNAPSLTGTNWQIVGAT